MIELLVAILLLSIISVGMYTLVFSSNKAGNTTQEAAEVSADVRRGFNRLVRDTREATAFEVPSPTKYTIEVDFNGDGVITPIPSDPTGNYERLSFEFRQASDGQGTIEISDGVNTEVLMDHVDCIKNGAGVCYPVFTFGSSRLLDLDTNQDGVTSPAELDVAPTIGNNNGLLDGDEINFIDRVSYALKVTINKQVQNFYAEAQLRNRR
jgi:type II secretory pathway pseudopilin PulG